MDPNNVRHLIPNLILFTSWYLRERLCLEGSELLTNFRQILISYQSDWLLGFDLVILLHYSANYIKPNWVHGARRQMVSSEIFLRNSLTPLVDRELTLILPAFWARFSQALLH